MYEITRMDNINFVIFVRDPVAGTYEYHVFLHYDCAHNKREWDRNPDHIWVDGSYSVTCGSDDLINVHLRDDSGNEWVRVFLPNSGSNGTSEVI